MNHYIPEKFFQTVQKSALPGVWAKGVSLARVRAVTLERAETSPHGHGYKELRLRVRSGATAITPLVTLWPSTESSADEEEGECYCDCGDRNDPCHHIAAAVVALRTPELLVSESPDSAQPGTEDGLEIKGVQYLLEIKEECLYLERLIPSETGPKPLREPLIAHIGGIQSGRIHSRAVQATQDDFKLDQLLTSPDSRVPYHGALQAALWPKLFPFLKEAASVRLSGKKIGFSSMPFRFHAEIRDQGEGLALFPLGWLCDGELEKPTILRNGVALSGETLHLVQVIPPSLEAALGQEFFSSKIVIEKRNQSKFLLETLPKLEQSIIVRRKAKNLPELVESKLHVLLSANRDPEGGLLEILARLVYLSLDKSEEIAEASGGDFYPLPGKSFPRQRDREGEVFLTHKLLKDLQLRPGQTVRYEKSDGMTLLKKATGLGYSVKGLSQTQFVNLGQAVPRVTYEKEPFSANIRFVTSTGDHSIDLESAWKSYESGMDSIFVSDLGYASLPADWLDTHADTIKLLLDAKSSGAKKLSYASAQRLAELAPKANPDWLSELSKILESPGIYSENVKEELEALLPPLQSVELRSYQRHGIGWLLFRRKHRLGSLLADDMGLGKTLQAIASFQGLTLVVAPTSVLSSWKNELARFRPELPVVFFHGPHRKLPADLRENTVVLTSYGILRQDLTLLTSVAWKMAVLDEAQQIKNPESQTARAACQIGADFKLALSGTPMENRPDDLWSLFQFLNPALVGSLDRFRELAAKPEALRKRLRPFILRRTKQEAAPELPEKTEQTLFHELSALERKIYDSLLATTRTQVLHVLETKGVFQALELLLRLRQSCAHSKLVPGSEFDSELSSKFELLFERLTECVEEGHKALVFSQWTKILDLLEPLCKARGIAIARLDGGTRNRSEVVSQFQSAAGPPVFLISLKAGGVGLTLTEADHVFLLDPWWNPAVEKQAGDRAHRIGQEKPVFIYRLIAENTVEEKILALQRKKAEWAEAFFENEEGPSTAPLSTGINRNDILELLS